MGKQLGAGLSDEAGEFLVTDMRPIPPKYKGVPTTAVGWPEALFRRAARG